ncbi:MAG: hypothetical protein LBL35_07395, partial [Clostridiales bacterium]|nr:hypothetical protein [Clostridiales bacterium]
MQAIITRDKWKFNSPYPIIEISEMIISNELNGHASLWAKGTLNCGPDEIEEIRNGSNAGDEVSV